MSWYEHALSVVRRTVAENPTLEGAELRKAVSEAYPFGEREMWPYKAWCKAVSKVLGPSQKQLDAQAKQLAKLKEKIRQGGLDV